jgi:hypothetical protein
MRLEGVLEMAICAACGCSSGKEPDRRRDLPDFPSVGGQGVAAESSRREFHSPSRSLGRALHRQRSRWLHLSGFQRLRRVMLFGVTPVMFTVLSTWMVLPAPDDQAGVCPSESAPTAESVVPMLDDSGTIKMLDLTERSSIAVTIVSNAANNGGAVDLRRQMSNAMRELHQVAQCYPSVSVIRANLFAPGVTGHDEHGNLVAGSGAPIVSLLIRTSDLRAFGQGFDWNSYPVYAANRYVMAIDFKLGDTWHRELQREEQVGNFVNTL